MLIRIGAFLGNVNFTVSAEALESQEPCGTEVAVVPEFGKKDTIIKSLLVEVSKPSHSIGHCEPKNSGELKVPSFR